MKALFATRYGGGRRNLLPTAGNDLDRLDKHAFRAIPYPSLTVVPKRAFPVVGPFIRGVLGYR